MGCVIDRVPWVEVDERVGVQRTNRETQSPAISVFRWWARRQHPAMGAILDAARAELGSEGLVVSDPFSGGGTVAMEAVRRGLPVYAQDLYPWPVRGLAAALSPAPPGLLEDAARRLLEALDPYRAWYRRQEDDEVWETTHVLRVRVIPCPHCDVSIHLRRCWRSRSTAPGTRRRRCSWRTCCGTKPWRRRSLSRPRPSTPC